MARATSRRDAGTRAPQREASVVDSAADGIVTIDETGRIRLFNRAAERLFGYTRREALGRDVVLLMPSPHREEHAGYVTRYLQTNIPHILGVEREVVGLHKNGSTFPMALRVTELKGPKARGRSFVAIVQDLRPRKRLEGMARRAEAMEAVARFASGIVHDVNNVIIGGRGFAKTALGRTRERSPGRKDLEGILQACERASSLAHQLLVVGGGQPRQIAPIEVNEVIESMTPMLRQIAGDDVRLGFALDPGTPRVFADRTQIEQVVMNLVVNARDASPPGGRVEVRTRTAQVIAAEPLRHLPVPPGAYTEIAVIDGGFGMEPGTLARIFEPFFTTKEMGKGTGLGLATGYAILQQNGGGIDVESAPGRGSTFRVLFRPMPGA